MTQSQYLAITKSLREIHSKVDRVEDRLRWHMPTEREALADLHSELDEIVAGGHLPQVFADD